MSILKDSIIGLLICLGFLFFFPPDYSIPFSLAPSFQLPQGKTGMQGSQAEDTQRHSASCISDGTESEVETP